MTKVGEVYECEVCGNTVSMVAAGAGTLVCCGQDMKLLEPKTAEQEGKEKHVPVLSVDGDKVTVKVGSIEHPMEEDHWIELVQLWKGDALIAEKRLYPGERPEAVFLVADAEGLKARELCNKHGLWTD